MAAGSDAGIGLKALPPIIEAMGDPLKTKTITLSCQKLTTGVTVKPWSGIFMLRNLQAPESYFQAAFRVQSSWSVSTESGDDKLIKPQCYIFDFAFNRALKLVADYAISLNVEETSSKNPVQAVEEFTKFLPIYAYHNGAMYEIDAEEVLHIAQSGTSGSMLARSWQDLSLVNVDNDTLNKILSNEEAIKALESIEGFRNLNQDFESIINKSEHVKKVKKNLDEEDISKKDRKKLSDEEKEYKSNRKYYREKLLKFATRVPVFMYLTDYREFKLIDVIKNIEPDLFKKLLDLKLKILITTKSRRI